MGYSELCCRLCGVSFNIGRRRLASEPAWMGWENTGDQAIYGCQLGKGHDPETCNDIDPDEQEQSDYEDYHDHGHQDQNEGELSFSNNSEQVDDAGNYTSEMIETAVSGGDEEADMEAWMEGEDSEDYVPSDTDDEEEPLEFTSDDEASDTEDGDTMDVDTAECEYKHDSDDTFTKFKKYMKRPPKHNCFRGKGYRGENISAEEMIHCGIAQCLIRKKYHDGASQEEPDDLAFERGGGYCLTGLVGHVSSRDSGENEMKSVRHGVSDPFMDNIMFDHSMGEQAICFHPTCFDIFTRLSRRRYDSINFSALGRLFFESSYEECLTISSDLNVQSCSEQWWEYYEGFEYLAANPLVVPHLATILREAIRTTSDGDNRVAFEPRPQTIPQPAADDPFARLPLELRLHVLSFVCSRDVASLRLVSRTFTQLPMVFFRDLLAREMPWLWELRTFEEPFIWATTTYDAVEEHEKQDKELQEWREWARHIIRAELPEVLDAWEAEVTEILSRRTGFLEQGRTAALEKIVSVAPGDVPEGAWIDWYQVFVRILREWEQLKGLRNRKRIWKDVEKMVERLDEYTREDDGDDDSSSSNDEDDGEEDEDDDEDHDTGDGKDDAGRTQAERDEDDS